MGVFCVQPLERGVTGYERNGHNVVEEDWKNKGDRNSFGQRFVFSVILEIVILLEKKEELAKIQTTRVT